MGALFGICGTDDAAILTYHGIYAGLHRGHEGAGICVAGDGENFCCEKKPGVLSRVFDASQLAKIPGRLAIGHTRSATCGECNSVNLQPLVAETRRGTLALAHVGHITNAPELRRTLERRGAKFQSEIDSEVILQLIAHSRRASLEGAFVECLGMLEGAYSFVVLAKGQLIVARDRRGFRPLVYGKLENSGEEAWVFASETCCLDIVGAAPEGEVEPGEFVLVKEHGQPLKRFFASPQPGGPCAFEHVYVSRPDSVTFGRSVEDSRHDLGRRLAREHPVSADIVVGVPDSGIQAAIGYAAESGIPYGVGVIRNHYVGRMMIEPRVKIRNLWTKVKFNPVRTVVEGKRVVLVDDSIVRCLTAPKLVGLLREAGAREVHLCISCPPIVSPCFFGVSMPPRQQLAAAAMPIPEIRAKTGADSLGFLSLEETQRAIGDQQGQYCYSCWTGEYPIRVPLAQIGS